MKIYDCFTFYNEFDLLEIRLQELYNEVDWFVIVEADRTFQNQPKPLYLTDNFARFEKWSSKIRLVTVTDMPTGNDAWAREEHQRNAILGGIGDADADDMIVISDVDEIPRPETIQYIKSQIDNFDIYAFYMPLFNFKFNYMMVSHDKHACWGQAIRRSYLDELTPEFVRRNRFYCHGWPNAKLIPHAGWHFSWLGNNEMVKNKVQSFSHAESNLPELIDQIDVNESLKNGTTWNRNAPERMSPVVLNDYFPKTITANTEKYLHWILDTSAHKVTDFI